MRCGERSRRAADEAGQTLVIAVVFMTILLAMAGFAIDVGHAYLVQRQLQAGVDAAALAGAQELPDAAQARLTAEAYGPTPGADKPNDVTTVDNAVTTVETTCLVSYGCTGRRGKVNGIRVTATSTVPTWFTRVIGHDSFTVDATSTACSPCTAKKFDVMVVLDRTTSMQGADLTNAKNGIGQFLRAMDPGLDAVGLAVYPPAIGNASCTLPQSGVQDYGYDAWWPSWDRRGLNDPNGDVAVYAIGSPTQDYAVESPAGSGNWVLNGGSSVVQLLGCVGAQGTTSYATALADAKHELVVHGRGDAQDVIVFFTDGAANAMPEHLRLPTAPPGVADGLLPLDLTPFRNRPCRAGVEAANWAKAQGGTLIYTIGYDVRGANGGNCGDPGYTAVQALQEMATDSTLTYYEARAGDDLGVVFEQIASDIRDRAGRLLPDSAG